MSLREIRTGYNYNDWANRRILAAAARLSPEQYAAPTTHSSGSLRGTLIHLFDAEIFIWSIWVSNRRLFSLFFDKTHAFNFLEIFVLRP